MLRDRVERSTRQLAVVGHPDLDLLAQAGLRHLLARELGLRGRERHAGDRHAVVLRRVDREAAPAAADVQQAHARLQGELARDQIELRELSVLERLRALRVDRAAVGHRLVEEQPEELVADVVVVADRGRVALRAVALAAQDQLEARALGDPARQRGGQDAQPQTRPVLDAQLGRLPFVDHDERRRPDRRPPASRPHRRGPDRACRAPAGSATAPTGACTKNVGAPSLVACDHPAVPEAHVERPLRERLP